jgi:outer membrane protein assembly factor BamB
MRLDQLVFVGLNGYALALDRHSGEIVWSNNKLESGPVTLLLDGDRLIVSTGGYIFCLDPLTGEVKWNNPLKGYGMAAPTALVSTRGQSQQGLGSHHQQASSDTTTAAVIAGTVTVSSS